MGQETARHPWYCSVPAIVAVFLVRTVMMNTTKPLTRSIVMDAVPKHQRGRWNGLESINAATWAGSAVMGESSSTTTASLVCLLQRLSCRHHLYFLLCGFRASFRRSRLSMSRFRQIPQAKCWCPLCFNL